MEFLRFGSSIPGAYWGCCAVCIIQNFKVDPDAKASIQMVNGDAGSPEMRGNQFLFVGPTYLDIFKNRIRTGTFSTRDMPNHVFLAVLTQQQVSGGVGLKWLKILKEEGFEFIRTTDNSVYTGDSLEGSNSPHPNYLFGLFRNITGSRIKDPLTPPAAWTSLESVVPEAYQFISPADKMAISDGQTHVHKEAWKKSKTVLMTESEVVKAGVPVTYAGLRSEFPQELKSARDSKKAAKEKLKATTPKTSAFPAKAVAA